jgi:hypothetical protein
LPVSTKTSTKSSRHSHRWWTISSSTAASAACHPAALARSAAARSSIRVVSRGVVRRPRSSRFTAFLTDQPDPDLAALDTRHRAHAHVEDRIRGAKDSGARTLPCDTFERNAVWLQLVLMAQDLMVFTQVLTLDGDLRLAEPQQLRYKLLHAPARIVRSGRRLRLRIQHDWPWAKELVAAFARLWALLLPAI